MSLRTYTDTPTTDLIKASYLDDITYVRVLDAMVIVCVDAVIVDTKKKIFYLATRRVDPIKGLWMIGGVFLRENPTLMEL